jgi:hypothetical protein
MADEHARVFASIAQEDSERAGEARELEDDIEVSRVRLSECFALRNHPRLGEDAREEARGCIASIRAARETLKRDYSAYI